MSPEFDFVVIDCEHGSASLRDVENAIRAIEIGGSVPFVRIDRPENIGRYLDAGALGIIAPDIRTAGEARRIVGRAKFPPHGERSFSLARCTGYGRNAPKYYARANEAITVVAMIEHVSAIIEIPDITSVDGIDAVLIGPYDLSGSLGCPGDFESPVYCRALRDITGACSNLDVPFGVHYPHAAAFTATECLAAGMKFVAVGMDTTTLSRASAEITRQTKTRGNHAEEKRISL